MKLVDRTALTVEKKVVIGENYIWTPEAKTQPSSFYRKKRDGAAEILATPRFPVTVFKEDSYEASS